MSAWKVVLRASGAPDRVQSRLAMTRPDGVTWYRRASTIMLAVNVEADAQADAEQRALHLVRAARVEVSVVKSKPLAT